MKLPAGEKVTSRQFLSRPYPAAHAGSTVGGLYHTLQTQSSAPEDGRNYRPKHVELIEITNKLLLLHLVGCIYH